MSWRQHALLRGAGVRLAELAPDGAYDLDALAATITPRTKLVVIVSPNNPTGQAVGAADLSAFLDHLPEHVLPVLDEAYFEYLPADGHNGATLLSAGRRLLVTRTFSKAFGLAGLRVGYLLGPPEFLAALGKVRSVFDVNAVAQAGATASLAAAPDQLPERIALIAAERQRVDAGLRARGFTPLPSTANFLTFPAGDAERAARLNDALLRRGLIVRPLGSFGAPEAIRVTIGAPDENTLFLDALAAVIADGAI